METTFNKNGDLNNMKSKLLQQHWAPVLACGIPFPSKQNIGKMLNLFNVTRHWHDLANHWLQVSRQFLWLDPDDSSRPSHDSLMTWRACGSDLTSTRQIWLRRMWLSVLQSSWGGWWVPSSDPPCCGLFECLLNLLLWEQALLPLPNMFGAGWVVIRD